jgi:hypothetical protein
VNLFQTTTLKTSNGWQNIFNTSEKISESSYEVGTNYFNSTGTSQSVSLFSLRNETYEKSIYEEEGIIIENSKKGWNISEFSLNFTEIAADEEYVDFQTRIDGADPFKASSLSRSYATSFQIPNTCNLRNVSIFLQYPGGTAFSGQTDSTFNITVYNCSTEFKPEEALHNWTFDEIQFDLTSEYTSQPAQWYTSNFTDRVLNISDTYNRTFFAVFQSIDYPSTWFGDPISYMYYGEEKESDKYNLTSYKRTGNGNWNPTGNRSGLLKVNLAPIDPNPFADEINLTVFNKQVNSTNLYTNNTFYEHQDDEFFIPISSPWFGDIQYNVTFEGRFRYDTLSSSEFRALSGGDVQWNLTVKTGKFEGDSYNNSAIFYYPEFWNYTNAYNGTQVLDEDLITQYSNYIEVANISNDAKWILSFNQSNDIINSTFYSSETNSDWNEFDSGGTVNAYNNINVSAQFNNSHGDALLYVYRDGELDIEITQELNNETHTFPLWSPRYNTSMTENGTVLELKIMTTNGTMAGIITESVNVELIKSQPTLIMKEFSKQSYIYGETIDLAAVLTSGQQALEGEPVLFTIISTYSNGATTISSLAITTNEQGIAAMSYPIGEVESVTVLASYEGNVDYSSAALSSPTVGVKSPEMQFFLDYLPYFIAGGVALIIIVSYVTIKKYRFKQHMKEWKKTTALFSDILKVDLILIIHKEVGVAIVKENFTGKQMDGDLISGFLQAITSFKYEIKKRDKTEGAADEIRESILLDYRDYKILLEDGEFIRFALVLNAEPSENLKESQNEFIEDFEQAYYDALKNFSGELRAFKNAVDLVNKHFNMSMALPQVVNDTPPPIELNSFQENIISVAKTLQSDLGQFHISRLLNYLISAMPSEPKERIIASVFELENKGFLEAA